MFGTVQPQDDPMIFCNLSGSEQKPIREQSWHSIHTGALTRKRNHRRRMVFRRYVKGQGQNTQPNIINNQGVNGLQSHKKSEVDSSNKQHDQTVQRLTRQIKKMGIWNEEQNEGQNAQDTIIKKLRQLTMYEFPQNSHDDQSDDQPGNVVCSQKKRIKRRFKYWHKIKRNIGKGKTNHSWQQAPNLIQTPADLSWANYFQANRMEHEDTANCFSDIYFQDQIIID